MIRQTPIRLRPSTCCFKKQEKDEKNRFHLTKVKESKGYILLLLTIMDLRLQAFERLLNIMDDLREKCPWDQKQTIESLRNLTIEETYELADAITKNDLKELKGEIGDLLLHMVFYCKIAEEKKAFTITDALNGICEKLIHRHPHIYGDVKVVDEADVKANWEKLR